MKGSRTRPAAPESSPRPPASRPGSGALGRIGTIALIALPIIIAAFLLRPRGGEQRARVTEDQVLIDSLKQADARRDWVSGLRWAEQLGQRHPRDHGVLLARGTAWSNYAIDQRHDRIVPRPALRTSLERMECIGRALALMDSSAMATSDTTKWIDSGVRLAQLDETIGLWGDALIAYETIKQRVPNNLQPALRAYWVRALMYDPVDPDTSEWDRHMRSIGRR